MHSDTGFAHSKHCLSSGSFYKLSMSLESDLDEQNVGIETFLSSEQEEIRGTTKYRLGSYLRFTDFIVNEVREDGQLVYLDESKQQLIEDP